MRVMNLTIKGGLDAEVGGTERKEIMKWTVLVASSILNVR